MSSDHLRHQMDQAFEDLVRRQAPKPPTAYDRGKVARRCHLMRRYAREADAARACQAMAPNVRPRVYHCEHCDGLHFNTATRKAIRRAKEDAVVKREIESEA